MSNWGKIGLLAGLESTDGENWVFSDGFMRKKAFDPYNSNRFTGALVKAVFPLLAERGWYIRVNEDGTIEICKDTDCREIILTAPNLNTALIEAWKIHNPV
jgi:hypothetical protein